MTITKLERAATYLQSLRQDCEMVHSGHIALDALTVHQSPTKAIALSGWWQYTRELEVRAEDDYDGVETYGENIRNLAWELHEAGYLPSTPQYGYALCEDDGKPLNEEDDDFKYDDDLLTEALCKIRGAILNAIYVAVPDA